MLDKLIAASGANEAEHSAVNTMLLLYIVISQLRIVNFLIRKHFRDNWEWIEFS